MRVIVGVALFLLGTIAGGGALAYKNACVRRVEHEANAECIRLRMELGKARRQGHMDDSYWKGYADGRADCRADMERLAQPTEARQTTTRTRKGA